jgi:hypothetical protein
LRRTPFFGDKIALGFQKGENARTESIFAWSMQAVSSFGFPKMGRETTSGLQAVKSISADFSGRGPRETRGDTGIARQQEGE